MGKGILLYNLKADCQVLSDLKGERMEIYDYKRIVNGTQYAAFALTCAIAVNVVGILKYNCLKTGVLLLEIISAAFLWAICIYVRRERLELRTKAKRVGLFILIPVVCSLIIGVVMFKEALLVPYGTELRGVIRAQTAAGFISCIISIVTLWHLLTFGKDV